VAYLEKLFNINFLEYASYVIKDRAIPDLSDGLKPVQRRILHSLFEMDDGKFHKVANIVGHCMKYHPHGDASIYSALVGLANKDLFIDKQGNFGNQFTGDPASAARYIEARILPLAKKTLYNPAITQFVESYDGRNKEPVSFPAKIPLVLIQGAEGIAVGMSTKILPHNFVEVLEAVKRCIEGKSFVLYPDFPTGGLSDVSDYQDGMGRVLVRAKLDTSDPKRIMIRELPFGATSESLMASIESAARRNKIKVQSITDFTTDKVEIEIKLARGVLTKDTVDALFAYTDCESAIAVNLLVIRDNVPVTMTVTEVIKYHAESLLSILKAELKIEEGLIKDKIHARTLERIFIEERIYKKIETVKTKAGVEQAVIAGLKPFDKEIQREVTPEDVERLLKIPIRRISLYDINKTREEVDQLKANLALVRSRLKNLSAYAVSFLDSILADHGAYYPRRTEIKKFQKVDVREVAVRNIPLIYDEEGGYLGTGVRNGTTLLLVSDMDRILVIRRTGVYSVCDVPEKLFVDKGLLHCALADKEEMAKTVITVIYKDGENGYPYIKRCKIEQFILEKTYLLIPDGCTVLRLTTKLNEKFTLVYKPKPRLKVLEESFSIADYGVKGLKAAGVRLSNKETAELKTGKRK
jgi:topoisomerase-4 subunit A